MLYTKNMSKNGMNSFYGIYLWRRLEMKAWLREQGKTDEKRMKGYVTESTNSVIYFNYAGRL